MATFLRFNEMKESKNSMNASATRYALMVSRSVHIRDARIMAAFTGLTYLSPAQRVKMLERGLDQFIIDTILL